MGVKYGVETPASNVHKDTTSIRMESAVKCKEPANNLTKKKEFAKNAMRDTMSSMASALRLIKLPLSTSDVLFGRITCAKLARRDGTSTQIKIASLLATFAILGMKAQAHASLATTDQ